MNSSMADHFQVSCVLAPQSIAVVGASENADKIGGRCLQHLLSHGFEGVIFPINPAREVTQGVRSYPSLDVLPGVPDLVIVAVPGVQAVEAIEASARLGSKAAVILSAGFAEAGPEGTELQQRMSRAAQSAGMRLVGPNTLGVANFSNGVVASFATMFVDPPPQDGPIAVIGQSGGGCSVPYGLLRERGIGVRYFGAVGNQCDVTVAELALAVVEDPDLRLMLMYLEGMPDALRLAELGRRARERGLPVLVLKGGNTAAGQKASLSHTGSLATERRVVDAFLEHHGLKRVPDMLGLVHATELYLKGWRAKGRRLVVISNSGTACVLAADAASTVGLVIDELQQDTQAELARVLPAFATLVNPVDITAALMNNSRLFGDILPIIARDPGADAFLISLPVAGRGYDADAFVADAAEFAATTGKPIVIVAPQPKVAAKFRARDLPVFVTESEAIAALHQFIEHQELMAAAPTPPGDSTTAQALRRPVPAAQRQVLDEAASLARVRVAGVPVVRHVLCTDLDQALGALREFGPAVAVKGCTSAVTHKSEAGLVKLAVRDEDGLRRAWSEVRENARARGNELAGVIVAEMARGLREFIVGAHVDPTLGPVVTVGDGGRHVEALGDVQVLMADATASQVRRAIGRLRIAPVLAGVRG
jgi:acetate---CoA ligase (ADP-forming)